MLRVKFFFCCRCAGDTTDKNDIGKKKKNKKGYQASAKQPNVSCLRFSFFLPTHLCVCVMYDREQCHGPSAALVLACFMVCPQFKLCPQFKPFEISVTQALCSRGESVISQDVSLLSVPAVLHALFAWYLSVKRPTSSQIIAHTSTFGVSTERQM